MDFNITAVASRGTDVAGLRGRRFRRDSIRDLARTGTTRARVRDGLSRTRARAARARARGLGGPQRTCSSSLVRRAGGDRWRRAPESGAIGARRAAGAVGGSIGLFHQDTGETLMLFEACGEAKRTKRRDARRVVPCGSAATAAPARCGAGTRGRTRRQRVRDAARLGIDQPEDRLRRRAVRQTHGERGHGRRAPRVRFEGRHSQDHRSARGDSALAVSDFGRRTRTRAWCVGPGRRAVRRAPARPSRGTRRFGASSSKRTRRSRPTRARCGCDARSARSGAEAYS